MANILIPVICGHCKKKIIRFIFENSRKNSNSGKYKIPLNPKQSYSRCNLYFTARCSHFKFHKKKNRIRARLSCFVFLKKLWIILILKISIFTEIKTASRGISSDFLITIPVSVIWGSGNSYLLILSPFHIS